jgi:hypothetical protein
MKELREKQIRRMLATFGSEFFTISSVIGKRED